MRRVGGPPRACGQLSTSALMGHLAPVVVLAVVERHALCAFSATVVLRRRRYRPLGVACEWRVWGSGEPSAATGVMVIARDLAARHVPTLVGRVDQGGVR